MLLIGQFDYERKCYDPFANDLGVTIVDDAQVDSIPISMIELTDAWTIWQDTLANYMYNDFRNQRARGMNSYIYFNIIMFLYMYMCLCKEGDEL